MTGASRRASEWWRNYDHSPSSVPPSPRGTENMVAHLQHTVRSRSQQVFHLITRTKPAPAACLLRGIQPASLKIYSSSSRCLTHMLGTRQSVPAACGSSAESQRPSLSSCFCALKLPELWLQNAERNGSQRPGLWLKRQGRLRDLSFLLPPTPLPILALSFELE